MPPLKMGFNGTFEISTYIAAFVQAGTQFVPLQCRNNVPVTIETQVQIGNYTYFGSAVENVFETSAEAHNLSTQVEIANISAKPGDVISYSMEASTSCPYTITLEWGGAGVYAGGIVIVGELFSPVVESAESGNPKLPKGQFVQAGSSILFKKKQVIS